MATNLISFPFRVDHTGAIATLEDGTDDYYAEELAVLILTQPGERPLVPEYGLTDPAYGEFDEQELEAKIDLFGPPVQLTEIKAEFVSSTQEAIQVTFERLEDEGDADYEDDYYEDEELIDA